MFSNIAISCHTAHTVGVDLINEYIVLERCAVWPAVVLLKNLTVLHDCYIAPVVISFDSVCYVDVRNCYYSAISAVTFSFGLILAVNVTLFLSMCKLSYECITLLSIVYEHTSPVPVCVGNLRIHLDNITQFSCSIGKSFCL